MSRHSHPPEHTDPGDITPAAYAAIHGPTVGDRVRLGDTRLVVEIEYDAQQPGNEFLVGFGKTARDGLLLKAASVADTCDLVISNVVVIDAMHGIGKLGALVQRIQRVMRQIALRAAGFTADQAHGFKLRQQIIPAAIHMQHAIGKAPAAFLSSRHQPGVF